MRMVVQRVTEGKEVTPVEGFDTDGAGEGSDGKGREFRRVSFGEEHAVVALKPVFDSCTRLAWFALESCAVQTKQVVGRWVYLPLFGRRMRTRTTAAKVEMSVAPP